jgi:hypothetical protein
VNFDISSKKPPGNERLSFIWRRLKLKLKQFADAKRFFSDPPNGKAGALDDIQIPGFSFARYSDKKRAAVSTRLSDRSNMNY